MQTIERIQRQPRTRANQGMAALYWISLASRPLSVTEISHALAVRTDSAKNPFDIKRICSRNTLLACCMGLVIIDEETSTVRLVHYSLQEFLQNDNDLEVSLFHIHTGHGLIAKTCLTYLRFCQSMTLGMTGNCACCQRYYKDIVPSYGLHYPKELPWEMACMCQSEFPLFDYAASEWGNHVREGYNTSIGSLAVEWLTAKETASCPCAMVHMSWVRDKYRPRSCPIRWLNYDLYMHKGIGWKPDSLLALAYFGEQHILEEMGTAVGQLELNATDNHGWTPLIWAAARGHDIFVKQLLKYKNEVDIMDTRGFTPPMHAAWHGNAKVIKQLLTPNSSQRVNLNAYDIHRRTAISYAAGRGHCGVIGILLHEAEVDPNLTCLSWKTPLMYAIQEGMTNAAKALLSVHRVSPTLQDKNGDTVLHLAVRVRAVEVSKLLLQNPRVDPNHEDRDGYTPLALAARGGYAEVVKLLLGDSQVDCNHENRHGYTSLALAASCGHVEVVKSLLGDSRVDPNHEDRDDYTPLALAARGGYAEVLKLLLEDSRVDPNHENRDGYTSLALAAIYGRVEAVEVLLGDPRVGFNHNGRGGYTPLALAARHGNREAVEVLLRDPRVDPSHKARSGYTSLALAASGGHTEGVEVLLGDPRVDPNYNSRGGLSTKLRIYTYIHICMIHWSPINNLLKTK